ncbi:MAG: hypothetical protein GY940_07760 [bacterium]|nr:hypothetical protein [bacterium]
MPKQTFKDSPHKKNVHVAAFSPDGEFILTGSIDGTACLWDSRGNIKKVFQGDDREIGTVAFSPDNTYFFIATKDIYVCPVQLPENPLAVLKGHTDYIKELSCDSQNRQLVSFSRDQAIMKWSLDGGISRVVKEKGTIRSSALSPDNKQLFTGFEAGGGRINQVTLPVNPSGEMLYAAFTGNNELLTGSADGEIAWWTIKGKRLRRSRLEKEQMEIRALAISHDAKRILTINLDLNKKIARLWQLESKNGREVFIEQRQIKFE